MKQITIQEVKNGFMVTMGGANEVPHESTYVFNDFGQVTDFLSTKLNKQDSRYVNEAVEVK